MAIFRFPRAQGQAAHSTGGDTPSPGVFDALLRLQATLDIEELLAHFTSLISGELAIDGYSYTGPQDSAIRCQSGHTNRHALAYQLVVDAEQLGELLVYRARPFTEHESMGLEDMLCLLVYPLRNALRYQEALRTSFTDPLTGLGNRSNMYPQIQREISLSHRESRQASLLMIDIDHFKCINDSHGHQSGDQVIICIANIIRSTVRDFDLVFRYGGEEFAVLLVNTDATRAGHVAERLRHNVDQHSCRMSDGRDISPTISIGLSALHDHDTPQSLIERADRALYRAKADGRNCVREYVS
ncbi:GGDEF domain-containing protein [Acidihalobacter prosperus]|uniref:diguanylate cyclase n=1 Tax=Acidihalobacter prosperus TaxID=160660 RepID=A0A1A6C5E4_9GAMM|nr:GGDEF domain-containing protein [Acidihalobacter prosperus]OBS09783.1 hypothetical protein Thpro_020833 [Acidihalobacter prosperus]